MPIKNNNVEKRPRDEIFDNPDLPASLGVSEIMMKMGGAPQELIDNLEGLRVKEDWFRLSVNISFYSKWLPLAFASYYEFIPDEHRYRFLMDLYAHGGDRVPAIRKEVRTASKYGSPVLPEELDGIDTITVYRAGDEDINKAKYRLSWTFDREKAEWFMIYSGLRKASGMHLYKGEIKREKIIGYVDSREEKEIIQYRNVRNIQEIEFMTYRDIINQWKKDCKESEAAG